VVGGGAGPPPPPTLPLARPPCVVKADGLAAGKGVFVCHTEEEVDAALIAATAFAGAVVVEELLEGREVSVFALCDGARAVPLGAAQDFKRIGDGDVGPNTGGMGAYSPAPELDAAACVERIHQPVLDELAERGTPFVGCLFAGLMIGADGARVLEFNARFGDPETQALVPRLRGDLLAALAGAAQGDAGTARLSESTDAAVTVVLAGPEYPDRSDYVGAEIAGVEDAEASGGLVFHGGTAMHDGRLVTNGGRIVAVTALAPTVPGARARAYAAVEKVRFEGARFRRDIAAAAS
jgi:phosphoribosylamine--glycine ligase